MSNKSDYNKPFTDVFELLPNVYKSNVNKALADNVFNRFLTKTELKNVNGVLGSEDAPNRLPEPDIHRQAFQLQPLLHNKIATVDHLSSFKDILRESQRIGINPLRIDEWANALQFNFVPPVDIDKIINYTDYYWLSPTPPSYIMIKNRLLLVCNVINQGWADISGLEVLSNSYTSAIPGPAKDAYAAQIELQYPGFVLLLEEKIYLIATNPGTNSWDNEGYDKVIDGVTIVEYTVSTVTIFGDYVSIFTGFPLFPFQITGSSFNDSTYLVLTAVYDDNTDTTEVTINSGTLNDSVVDGIFSIGDYDANDGTPVTINNPFNFHNSWNAWNSINSWTHLTDIPSGTNISLLQRAELPIIEYDSFVELNSWSHVNHRWNYRATNITGFSSEYSTPTNQEIFSSEDQLYDIVSFPTINSFTIDSATFPNAVIDLVPGAQFTAFFNNLLIIKYYTVVSVTNIPGTLTVELDASIPSGSLPLQTQASGIRFSSNGDDWKGFIYHWMYVGQDNHTPVDRQVLNNNLVLSNPSYLNQTDEIPVSNVLQSWYELPTQTFRSATEEIRVYVNGVRQYGTYIEGYFDGVTFTVNIPLATNGNAIMFFNPPGYGLIRVDVGPAASSDARKQNVNVRTNVDDAPVVEDVSLIEYRLTEQELSEPNQYPLFDVFNLDGSTSFQANPIWKFLESDEFGIHDTIGRRIVTDGQIFSFEQLLLGEDDGRMFAYKAFARTGDTTLSLLTIWRKGLNDEQYVPSYVDTDRNTVPIGDASGDWEVPDQMFHNLEHENKKLLTTTDLLKHFRTIISQQSGPTAFTGEQGNTWRVLLEPNLGLGGTIKEYNDGFDSFASSVFVKNVTMAGLLEFAHRRYDEHINKIRGYYEEAADSLFLNVSDEYIVDLQSSITQFVIDKFENNGSSDFVFGDSTVTGIKNWVATLPYVKLIEANKPAIRTDDLIGLVELHHHDGHFSTPIINNVDQSNIISRILKSANSSSGVLSSRPAIASTPKGHVFYATDVKTLFKFNVAGIGTIQPFGFPDGVYWLNTGDSMLYVKQSGTFVVSLDQDAAWITLDITKVYVNVLLEIETILYDNAPSIPLNYDVTQVMSDIDYFSNEQRQFTQFTKEYRIVNPAASVYDPLNSFTWNYTNVDVNDYIIEPGNTPPDWSGQSPATWYDLYADLYGTRYPQLEPWVLQGYNTEPTWWSSAYAGSTRRWSQQMWFNVIAAEIPAGELYPNGIVSSGVFGDVGWVPNEGSIIGEIKRYASVSVNVTDNISVTGNFQPDELMPPYFVSPVPSDSNIVQFGSLLQVAVPSGDASQEYPFGMNGPIEDSWRRSSAFAYNLTEIAYLTQPVRFVHFSMGNTYSTVDGLVVETKLNKVFSHRDTVFHGDIVNGIPVIFHGVNQWYSQYLRFNGYDINTSDFRSNWVDWRPTLSYQMAAMIDSESLNLASDLQKLDELDSTLLIKHTLGLFDSYIDSLSLIVSKVGSSVLRGGVRIPSGNGNDWEFRISTPNPSFQSLYIHGIDIGSPSTLFNVLDQTFTAETFDHYPINDTVTIEMVPGVVLSTLGPDYEGIQGLVNFIDGYKSFLEGSGYIFGSSSYTRIDPQYNRSVNWQLETERMINEIYVGMGSDELPIQFVGFWNYGFANPTTDEFIATGGKPLTLRDNDEVQMITTGILPVPFTETSLYYVVNVSGNTFQLALSLGGTPIVISTPGQGVHAIGMHKVEAATPASFFEINPFPNTVVFNNEQGVIADIHKGPFTDIRIEQGVYDQYGRDLSSETTRIYRGDKETIISVLETLPNDVIQNADFRNFLHIGGMHLFVDGYEHCILFNNTTIEGTLLFSEFLGSSVDHLAIAVRKQLDVTFRPNVGGHFLLNNDLKDNMEAFAENLQMMYDTNVVDETSSITEAARRLIGFNHTDYFDNMNVTLKSQLLFYKGVIQHKGATNAVNAFINSKNFIDASLDEFWAYKTGDFGDSRLRGYPEIVLTDRDSRFDTLPFHFTSTGDPLADNFLNVTFDDTDRWFNQPNQISEIFGEAPNLFFEAEVTATQEYVLGDFINGEYIKLPVLCDAVTIVAKQALRELSFVAGVGGPYTAPTSPNYIQNADSVRVFASSPTNGDGTFSIQSDFTENGSNVVLNSYTTTSGTNFPIVAGDIIRVTVGNATLVEGTHYDRINSQILFLDNSNVLYDTSIPSSYEIFCLNPAKTKLNPVKLIDYQSSTNIQNIGVWDPAKGHHYHNAEHIVDYQGTNPAFFTNSLTSDSVDRNLAWSDHRVGDVWWDKGNLGYIPYYDTVNIPDAQERVSSWGKLAEWSYIEIYEWVKATTHPSRYDQFVLDSQKDGNSISGTTKTTLFKRIRDVWGSELFDQPWVELNNIILHFNIALESGSVSVSQIDDNKVVSIYKNGIFHSMDTVVASVITIPVDFIISDNMTVIDFRYNPTEDELKFDPDIDDDGSLDVQYKFDYKYTEVQTVAPSGSIYSLYYFWVRHTATNHGGVSTDNAEQQLNKNPDPFVIFQNMLLPENITTSNLSTIRLPYRYTQSIFRGLVHLIVSNDRFKLRYTKDFTLRDDINDFSSTMNLKGKHTEWELLRERQKVNVARTLWNKLIETASGRNLIDQQPIPTLDRILYDVAFDSSFRFGLRDGQAMVDKQRAIDTILRVLSDPELDLYPIDREAFLTANPLDTADNIEITMEIIYTTFLPEIVNKIWFAVLYEGLASNINYTDIFKTSWVQLDGVRLLDISGVLS